MRKALKSDLINEQTVSRNSYGAHVLNYSAPDSLQKVGSYEYKIFGIHKQTQFPFLLVTRVVEYTEPKPKVPAQRSITLHLDFKDKIPFKVLVYDDVAHTVLKKFTTEFEKSKGHSLEIDLGEFIDNGLRQFMVLVSDDDGRQTFEFYYAVDRQGRLVKQ